MTVDRKAAIGAAKSILGEHDSTNSIRHALAPKHIVVASALLYLEDRLAKAWREIEAKRGTTGDWDMHAHLGLATAAEILRSHGLAPPEARR